MNRVGGPVSRVGCRAARVGCPTARVGRAMARVGCPTACGGRPVNRTGHPVSRVRVGGAGHPTTRVVPATAEEDRPVTLAPENGDAR